MKAEQREVLLLTILNRVKAEEREKKHRIEYKIIMQNIDKIFDSLLALKEV